MRAWGRRYSAWIAWCLVAVALSGCTTPDEPINAINTPAPDLDERSASSTTTTSPPPSTSSTSSTSTSLPTQPTPTPNEPEPVPDAPQRPLNETPYVVVGVNDIGINVYHDIYADPTRTQHPCTYIENYPCWVPALELTLDAETYEDAYAADRDTWLSIGVDDAFWIPGTRIIYAGCDSFNTPISGSGHLSTEDPVCILRPAEFHGTGTTSSVLTENPDALLAFVDGTGGGWTKFSEDEIPIDVFSYSWGAAIPLPLFGFGPAGNQAPLVFAAAGNEAPFPAALDATKASTNKFLIGGADATTKTDTGYKSWKTVDFVSEFCRPVAAIHSLNATKVECGTSFSAPTAAGTVSQSLLQLRDHYNHVGGLNTTNNVTIIDGHTTLTAFRHAINATATYDPDPTTFPPDNQPLDPTRQYPLIEAAPYLQWGWGYLARNEAPGITQCVLAPTTCNEKSPEATQFMELLWTLRDRLTTFHAGETYQACAQQRPDCPLNDP